MPRNYKNPIEARGRVANFRAKPIVVTDTSYDWWGATPNSIARPLAFYISHIPTKKNYDTRVAQEWYLDNVFLPDFIDRALKYFSPIGAESSQDKISAYPKPVQSKMIEDTFQQYMKMYGLPQVFDVEVPFYFDDKLVVPGDIGVGYFGLIRKYHKNGSQYFEMPSHEELETGEYADKLAFGPVVFLRYDWMLSDEELKSRYRKVDKLQSSSIGKKMADVIHPQKGKTQSELYDSRKDKCVELSEQLLTDHPFFYNPLAYVSVIDVKRSLRDILNIIAPIEAIPYCIRKGPVINALAQYIYSFIRFGVHLNSTLHPKLENTDRYVFQIPRFGGTTEKEQLRDEIDRIFDKLYIRLVAPKNDSPNPQYSNLPNWNLGSVEVSDECDIRGRWNGYRLSIRDGGNGVENGYRVPDYSLVIATDEEIRLDWVYDRVRNVLDSRWDLPPMILVFPAGKSKEIPFSAEK